MTPTNGHTHKNLNALNYTTIGIFLFILENRSCTLFFLWSSAVRRFLNQNIFISTSSRLDCLSLSLSILNIIYSIVELLSSIQKQKKFCIFFWKIKKKMLTKVRSARDFKLIFVFFLWIMALTVKSARFLINHKNIYKKKWNCEAREIGYKKKKRNGEVRSLTRLSRKYIPTNSNKHIRRVRPNEKKKL